VRLRLGTPIGPPRAEEPHAHAESRKSEQAVEESLGESLLLASLALLLHFAIIANKPRCSKTGVTAGRSIANDLTNFDLAFEAERLAEGAFRLLDRFGLVFALDTDRLGADFALPVDFLVDFVAATFAPARAVDFLAMDLARPDVLFATEGCAAPSAANAASLTGSFMTASLCPTKV
jgi:hypothetical protein